MTASYHHASSLQALFGEGKGASIVYPCHSLVVSMDTTSGQQRFYMGHTNKVALSILNLFRDEWMNDSKLPKSEFVGFSCKATKIKYWLGPGVKLPNLDVLMIPPPHTHTHIFFSGFLHQS